MKFFNFINTDILLLKKYPSSNIAESVQHAFVAAIKGISKERDDTESKRVKTQT